METEVRHVSWLFLGREKGDINELGWETKKVIISLHSFGSQKTFTDKGDLKS